MKSLLTIALCIAFALSAYAEKRTMEWNGTTFHTFAVAPERVELFWQDSGGKMFRQVRALQAHLDSQGKRAVFIMNGGLFEEDGSPCGLLVIDGKELRPLNLRDGEGNFYLKPNGVFYTDASGAHVVSSDEYLSKRLAARIAVQSGPLLLRGGRIHPAFSKTSKWALHRNGVGILKDGRVVFAITEFQQEKRVTLHEFAEFFRSLGCENALFLDGDISQAYFDPKGEISSGNHFGTIFAVTE